MSDIFRNRLNEVGGVGGVIREKVSTDGDKVEDCNEVNQKRSCDFGH